MKVVDIRSIFSKRNIELFDVGKSYIYYAEEKNEGGHNDLFILEYNRSTGKERLVTNYTLEDPTFVEHLYAFDNTLLLILENGGNSMWLIEIDKTKGMELNRRKIVCTGSFRSCMALDADHLLIYMGPDEANAGMFRQYSEVTGCECLCYLYSLRTNIKHFVKSPIIAKLGTVGIRILWIYGIFPHHREVDFLFVSYPVSWIITCVLQIICYLIIKKRIAIKNSQVNLQHS